MANEAVNQEQAMTYIDFSKVRVNPNITLSVVESGKTVESIKRREKVVHIITTVFTYIFILALALTVMFPFYWKNDRKKIWKAIQQKKRFFRI